MRENKIVSNSEAIAKRNRISARIKISLAVVLVLGFTGTGAAKDTEKKEKIIKTASGGVAGTVSGITKNYISVLYDQDKEKNIDYEMLLPVDKDVQLEYKNSLSEIKVGDRVSVQYEDTTTENSEKEKTLKRKAKVVTFVGPAPPAPPEPE